MLRAGLGAGSPEPLPQAPSPGPISFPGSGSQPSPDSQVVDLGSACSAGMRLPRALPCLPGGPASVDPGPQGFFSKPGCGGAACLVPGSFPPPPRCPRIEGMSALTSVLTIVVNLSPRSSVGSAR